MHVWDCLHHPHWDKEVHAVQLDLALGALHKGLSHMEASVVMR